MRFLSAAVLGPIALLALWFGGLAWAMLIGIALAGLGMEWGKLAGRTDGRLAVLLTLAWVAAVVIGFRLGFLILAASTAFAVWRYGRFSALGLPYAGIGGLSLLWLRLQPMQGFNDTLLVVIVIWSTDIGAYLVGRVMGGKKLAPRISPGKTWSGSIGGLWRPARWPARCWRGCCTGMSAPARSSPSSSASARRPAICWKARSSANWA